MKFEIKNRWTGAVQFGCELDADIAGRAYRFQLGFAVKQAVGARASLARANLAGANLADADLAGAYLADAYLAGADLAGAKWMDGITIRRQPLQIYGLGWPVTMLDHHMRIGCELHLFADWAAFDDVRIIQMGGAAALKFWRAHKTALLALAASDDRGITAQEPPA